MPVRSKTSLPPPDTKGVSTLEKTLAQRRSIRTFARTPLSLEEAAQLLWAAQGITSSEGGRTAPSAGALYPLQVYLVAGDVGDLTSGVYRYHSGDHELRRHGSGHLRGRLAAAALAQGALSDGAAVLVITGAVTRTAAKYGSRAGRYVHIEAGHAAQNVYLQARSLGLGTVIIGAFEDDLVRDVLQLPAEETPLALMPVGRPR